MKKPFSLFSLMLTLTCTLILSTGCSKDSEPDGGNTTENNGNNNYGNLNGNLITIGSARDITYTSCVLLGTIDFPKITGDHTYGIVYMEALENTNFDYDSKLVYGGQSDKLDKEYYSCTSISINNSTADGKFEKQIIGLMPATTYYYRAYVRIGQNVNYSKVERITTKDPMPEITLGTLEATDIYAIKGSMNGVVNIGNLQDVNEDQEFGFIFTDSPLLNTPEKLTYEYYEQWQANHFETDEEIEEPDEVTTTSNLNGRISCSVSHLRPGVTYYYRTFFSWNGKYFYSPEVKSLKTLGTDVITVGTNRAEEVTSSSVLLSATIPYNSIGLDEMNAGFLISKVYTDASEFKMENALPWNTYNKDSDVCYISTTAYSKDFSTTINNLNPQTTYYICGYIKLGNYGPDDEELYIYGSMQHFTTTEQQISSTFEISSTGQYPWRENGSGTWISGNTGVDSSTSTLTVFVTHDIGDTFYFDWSVSSEAGYDSLLVDVDQDRYLSKSGTDNGMFRYEFDHTGTTVFTLTYSKDGSTSSGSDMATAGNFRLTH